MADKDYTELNERRLIYLQRIANTQLQEEISKAINRAYLQTRGQLIDLETVNTITKLTKLNKAITDIINAEMSAAWQKVTKDYEQLAVLQASFAALAVEAVDDVQLKVPFAEQIITAVNSSIMSLKSGDTVTAGTWAQFVKANINDHAEKYTSVISDAYRKNATGEGFTSVNEISKSLRLLNNGLLKRNADAIAITGATHYAAQGQKAMAMRNLDIIDKEYPIVTFDNHTSRICISIDGKYQEGWPVNESPIGYPPYHFRCRTIIGYMTIGQKEKQGTRTALSGKKGQEALEAFELKKERLRTKSQVTYSGKKDLNIFNPESIPATTKLDAWLITQPEWYIRDTLKSKKIADAFIAGRFSLKNLTDNNLRPLTIAELENKYL